MILYNLLLLHGFEYNFNLLFYYYKNILYVKYPMSTDDIPYIKKFKILYELTNNENQNKLTNNFYNYIASNNENKLYDIKDKRDILTEDFLLELQPLFKKYNEIQEEIKNLYANHNNMLQNIGKHYNSSDNTIFKNNWKSVQLMKYDYINKVAKKYLPITFSEISKLDHFMGWAFISVLKPGTTIPTHRGKYNFKLTCHIGISNLEDCFFIINNKKMIWKENDFFVFNDSEYHKVVHNGKKDRIVLIFDLFHPELTLSDRECIKTILN